MKFGLVRPTTHDLIISRLKLTIITFPLRTSESTEVLSMVDDFKRSSFVSIEPNLLISNFILLFNKEDGCAPKIALRR